MRRCLIPIVFMACLAGFSPAKPDTIKPQEWMSLSFTWHKGVASLWLNVTNLSDLQWTCRAYFTVQVKEQWYSRAVQFVIKPHAKDQLVTLWVPQDGAAYLWSQERAGDPVCNHD